MPDPTMYHARRAYLDKSGPANPNCIGFLHPRPLRGDVAVIVLADTPEIRAALANAGIALNPDEHEREDVAA